MTELCMVLHCCIHLYLTPSCHGFMNGLESACHLPLCTEADCCVQVFF